MTKKQIFDYFYTNSANLGVKGILMTMLGGVLISAIIYLTYYFSYKGVAYNRKFNLSLIVISLISIVIMLMISSNIVISLGMVGALSIVRFRTAVKDSRDTVFIFWAITEGLCVGSGNFQLALVTTLFIAIIMVISSFFPNIVSKYMLIISGGKTNINIDKVNDVLKEYAKNSKLRVTNKDSDHQEMIFEIKLKNNVSEELIKSIKKISGVKSVNLTVESNENVG